MLLKIRMILPKICFKLASCFRVSILKRFTMYKDGCQVMSNINLIPLGYWYQYNYPHLTCSSSCANTLFDEIFQLKKGNNSFKNVFVDLLFTPILHSTGPEHYFTLLYYLIRIVNKKTRFYIKTFMFVIYRPIKTLSNVMSL